MTHTIRTKPRKLDKKQLNVQKLDKLQQQQIKGGNNPWIDGP